MFCQHLIPPSVSLAITVEWWWDGRSSQNRSDFAGGGSGMWWEV